MRNLGLFLIAVFTACVAFAKDSSFYFKTSDNVRLFVKVAGKGKPVVFVHGGPGSTSYYLESQLSASLLEQEMQMIYFDQRGSGRSDSAKDYSLQRVVKDIEELRAALGHKSWSVMGHSFGGIIITNYAKQFPKSAGALLMIHGTVSMDHSMKSHLNFGINELKLSDPALTDTSKPLEQRVWKVHEQLTEKNLWYKLMFRNAYEKKFSDSITFVVNPFNFDFGNKVWGLPEYKKNYFETTATIKMPVLVITGLKDYAIGVDHYKGFMFPNMQVVKYIGGHASFQEEPQWFAEKVIDFMQKLKH